MNNTRYKKILLIRTDRLGDVILTTPAIKAVHHAYPGAHIAIIVRPYTELAVKGNPCLNEVIVYDKYKKLYDKLKKQHSEQVTMFNYEEKGA